MSGFSLAIRFLTGLLLVSAAWLKLHFLVVTIPDIYEELLVFIEFVVGIGLLSTAFACYFEMPAIILFALFLCSTIIKSYAGETNCGCFGDFTVSPAYVAILDFAVLASLVFAKRLSFSRGATQCSAEATRKKLTILGLFLLVAMGTVSFYPTLFMSGADAKKLVEVQRGKRLDFMSSVESAAPFESGEWRVLLVRSDCGTCERAIDEFLEQHATGTTPLGIIDFTQSENPKRSPLFEPGYVSQPGFWYLEKPIEILMIDGFVTEYRTYE